jgi:hypothetical protein
MVVVGRILQNGMWSAAAAGVDVDVDDDDDAAAVVVVPFLAGLVVQYVLGLSPTTMKLRCYSSTLLLSHQSLNSFPPVNILLDPS